MITFKSKGELDKIKSIAKEHELDYLQKTSRIIRQFLFFSALHIWYFAHFLLHGNELEELHVLLLILIVPRW
jgi:hypothetical protein